MPPISSGVVNPMLSAPGPLGAPSRTSCPPETEASPTRTPVLPPTESAVSSVKDQRLASVAALATPAVAQMMALQINLRFMVFGRSAFNCLEASWITSLADNHFFFLIKGLLDSNIGVLIPIGNGLVGSNFGSKGSNTKKWKK